MPSALFEPAIPPIERPQVYALHGHRYRQSDPLTFAFTSYA